MMVTDIETRREKQKLYQRAYRVKHASDPEWCARVQATNRESKRKAKEKITVEQIEKKNAYMREWYRTSPAARAKKKEYGEMQREKQKLDPGYKAWRAARRIEIREQMKQTPEGRAILAERNRATNLKRYYGLTIADAVALWEKQGRACAICRTPLPTDGYGEIDHCHATGKIRGILCMKCNLGIGMFKENVTVLRSAVDYVLRHNMKEH